MNRWLILLIGLLLAAGGAALLIVRFPQPLEPVAYVPKESLAVIEWDTSAHLWLQGTNETENTHSDSSRMLRTIVARLGFAPDLLEQMSKVFSLLSKVGGHSALQSLIDGRAVLAIVPDRSDDLLTADVLHHQWVLVVETDAEVVTSLTAEVLGPIQSRQAVVYQGERVETLQFQDGQTLTWWRRGRVVICSQQAGLVRRCIDQSLRRMISTSSGMLENVAYQRLKGMERQKVDLFCFLDVKRLGDVAPELHHFEVGKNLVLHHLALMHSVDKDRRRLEVVALANEESVAALIDHHRLPTPRRASWFKEGEEDALVSLWTNWFQPNRWWTFLAEHAHPNVVSLIASVGQQLADITDKPPEAFFDVFGDGFGVFITEEKATNQSNNFFGCLAVAIRDRGLIETALKRLLDGVQVITVKSGGFDIDTIMLAGGLLQPAYALTEDHLIIADRVELVELAGRQIGTAAETVGRNGEESGDDEVGNFFLFVRVGALIDQLVKPLTLMAKETGERDRLLSPESRRFVREVIFPLFEILRGVATGRVRGAVSGDTLLLEIEYTLTES